MARLRAGRDSQPDSFSAVVAAGCVFAQRALISFASPWIHARSLEENVAIVAPEFRRFATAVASGEELDAWVVELPAGELTTDVDVLGRSLRRFLVSLALVLSDGDRDLMSEQIETASWDLYLEGMDWFVIVFGPCYPGHHPRHSDPKAAFVMLQPIVSFERFGVALGPKSAPLRSRIRRDFANRGLPLDEALMTTNIVAYKFVKPVNIGDPPIRWWLEDNPARPSD